MKEARGGGPYRTLDESGAEVMLRSRGEAEAEAGHTHGNMHTLARSVRPNFGLRS